VARSQTELDAEASEAHPLALAIVADVTKREDVQRVVAETLHRFGRIDAWVNNAGRGISKPALQLTDEDIDRMMAVNVKSALYGIQAVMPHFQERGTGHIINISSMLGRVPFASIRSAYSASKAFLNSLTINLRMDLREKYPDIQVSTVFPGVVATEFGLHAVGGGTDSRQIPGAQTAEEVAEVIVACLRAPRADVYTRPGFREQVAGYYSAEDAASVEAGFGRGPAVRP
jgi:NADP-dependent 3-hydroxy acid dehydrogenase YdfG